MFIFFTLLRKQKLLAGQSGNSSYQKGHSKMRPLFAAVIIMFLITTPGIAGYCDSAMTPRQLSLKDSLSNVLQITQTFRVTVQNGLNARPFAEISQHLLDYGCWMIRTDTSLNYNNLAVGVAMRFRTLESDSLFSADTGVLPGTGDSAAPVTVVEYIAVECGHCREEAPALFHEVTSGSLKGKARLYIRTAFPSLGEKSLYAANKCGKFWDYFSRLLAVKEGFDKEEVVVKTARAAGIQAKAFKQALADAAVDGQCKLSFDESRRNGVNNTPAYFINGKRYTSVPSAHWVVDAVDYAYNTAMRRPKKPAMAAPAPAHPVKPAMQQAPAGAPPASPARPNQANPQH
jgi:hypothetical protein